MNLAEHNVQVIFNDPLVIVTARGLPMLLRSKVCTCLCSEGCIEYAGQAIEAAGAIMSLVTDAPANQKVVADAGDHYRVPSDGDVAAHARLHDKPTRDKLSIKGVAP